MGPLKVYGGQEDGGVLIISCQAEGSNSVLNNPKKMGLKTGFALRGASAFGPFSLATP